MKKIHSTIGSENKTTKKCSFSASEPIDERKFHTFYILHSRRDGQSLVEILVALAVGTILIVAATSIIVPALRANTQADKVQVASALGKELLENLRAFSEGDWHNISNLATSSANKYFLVSAQSPFVAATGTEGISADGVASGTVGYWKLDESTGTIAYDFSGNNSTGTWNGTGGHSATGMVGNAGQFNGTNDYVTKSSASFAEKPGTISLWFKANSINAEGGSSYQKMTLIQYGDIYWGLQISSSNNKIQYHYYDGTARDWNSNSAISIGQWYHLATVSTPTGSEMFLNGISQGTSTLTLFNNNCGSSCGFIIGGSLVGYPSGDSFNGYIDDVRLYNRALSATEVRTIYLSNIYTRYFYLDTVGRDASDVLLSSGGTNDPSTRKATVVYGWPSGPTSSFSMYLTRFRNNVFDQTDWFGGPGQEGPATTTNGKFSTSTSIDYSTTTGSITISY